MRNTTYSAIFAMAAIIAAGCSTESLPVQGTEGSIIAVMDADAALSKTILIDNPGIKMESFWEPGDQIGVFGGNVSNALFSVKAQDISEDRKTASFKTDGKIPSGKLLAYSPYQHDARAEGDAIFIDFPDVQRYITQNGVAQPDPSSHILLAEGSRNNGLSFRSATSILKIGQVFETATIVRRVEFRDLSGAPVCGRMKLSGGSSPKAEVSGEGKAITLDMGEGVEFEAGIARPFFMIVPSRNYSQGFEISFIDDQGNKTIRTAGATKGKLLESGIVYLIGDVSGNDYETDTKSVLAENTMLMTPEALDKVIVIAQYSTPMYTPDGKPVENHNGVQIFRPEFNLYVHKDLKPATGNKMVFNIPSSELPEGGVYLIKDCIRKTDDYYEVIAVPELNFASAFEELTIGELKLDENGVLAEDGGIELDLMSHLQSITNGNGEQIPFSVVNGEICFSEEETAKLLGIPQTKGRIAKKSFSTPKLALEYSSGLCSVTFGARLTMNTRLAVGIMQRELQYVYYTFNPVFELGADFELKAETEYSKTFPLIRLSFTPIMVGPVVITPRIDLDGKIGIAGEITFTTSVNYEYDMGNYGISYNKGDGFTMRYIQPEAKETELVPSLGGSAGRVYAYGGLLASPSIGLYGLFSMGVDADFALMFGYEIKSDYSRKYFLTPRLELEPLCSSLGGILEYRFNDLTTRFEFDPLWEKLVSPKVKHADVSYGFPVTDPLYDIDLGNNKSYTFVTLSPREWLYRIELEGKVENTYSVQVSVWESTVPIQDANAFKHFNTHQPPFSAYLAAGIPHMSSDVYGIDYDVTRPGAIHDVFVKTVGEYGGEGGQTVFNGTISGVPEVSSGHKFGTRIQLVNTNDASDVILIGGGHAHTIYCYPNDFYGRPYPLASESEE